MAVVASVREIVLKYELRLIYAKKMLNIEKAYFIPHSM